MRHWMLSGVRCWCWGESVLRFVEESARYCGVRFGAPTGSGTSALQLSLLALGVKLGDRVITTHYSFIATANAALHVNALPFADEKIVNPQRLVALSLVMLARWICGIKIPKKFEAEVAI